LPIHIFIITGALVAIILIPYQKVSGSGLWLAKDFDIIKAKNAVNAGFHEYSQR